MSNHGDIIYLIGIFFGLIIALRFFRLALRFVVSTIISCVDFIFEKFIQLLLSPFNGGMNKKYETKGRSKRTNNWNEISSEDEGRKLKIKKYMDIKL